MNLFQSVSQKIHRGLFNPMLPVVYFKACFSGKEKLAASESNYFVELVKLLAIKEVVILWNYLKGKYDKI